jgi:hypothetical protein
MTTSRTVVRVLAVLALIATRVDAQDATPPLPAPTIAAPMGFAPAYTPGFVNQPALAAGVGGVTAGGPGTADGGYIGTGLEPESLPGEIAEDLATGANQQFRLGATPVADVGILRNLINATGLLSDSPIRTFGWLEQGYTGASVNAGLTSVQPRLNRWADQYVVSDLGITIQKPLRQDVFNIGFNVRYFTGANAALGAPKGGVGFPPDNQHFGQDFRDLYLSAHLPILTDGGMDLKVGRMNTIIGWNGYLAPYRPFFSNDYQFFYSQDGAFTGFLTDWHVNDRLDIWNGMTLGANTFFTLRSQKSYCYLGQVNYWLTDEKKTRLTASTYIGPDAIFAAPGLGGDFVTMLEFRIQQNWSEKFTQVVQTNMGWDRNTPRGTGGWYGVFTQGVYHWVPTIDLNFRADWFDDAQGTRTGFEANYTAVTLGLNWHPVSFLEVRPEIRGDFADQPTFGGGGSGGGNYSQLTGVFSALIKF